MPAGNEVVRPASGRPLGSDLRRSGWVNAILGGRISGRGSLQIEFGGQLEEADVVSALWLHMRPRPALRVVCFLLVVLIAAGLAVSVVAASRGSGSWSSPEKLFGILLLLAGVFWWIRWDAIRSFRQQLSPYVEHRLRATDQQLEGSSAYGSGGSSWQVYIQ